MPEIETTRDRLLRFTHRLSAKLISLLLLVMVAVFALLGYVNIRLHRQHLEATTLASAERVSDVIRRSTSYYMMRNDREGLYHAIATMADEPGMVRVRIFDQEGRISYSSTPLEISRTVDKNAEACYRCHAQSQPLVRLNRPDRFRIFRDTHGQRILGIITPIENQASCSNAECHAHPASQQILGVLDTNLSLAQADAQLAQSSWLMFAFTAMALVAIACFSWLFILRLVDLPIKRLQAGTHELATGNLGFQIDVESRDELGELAQSFNQMSVLLRSANAEIVSWAKTLEDRVSQKTKELKRAHEHVLHIEKMATIGKMAAVMAHEINNPLAGILTYAKLIRKWIDHDQLTTPPKKLEASQCLDLIASESRRCGDLVKNLLVFSRTAPLNKQSTDVREVIDRSVRLVSHQLDLNGVQLQLDLPSYLPRIQCDPAQIEQVLIALVMNAIDAMPRGGNLWISARLGSEGSEYSIVVRDDGSGIAPEILSKIFEPFLTTKETGKGVGLGLAVSNSIVERHDGRIDVQSELGKGTTFTVTLPVESAAEPLLSAVETSSSGGNRT
jgi:two-component system, NtrC family, sensor kinase